MPNELAISMSDVALRLGVAALIGLVIGLERERLDRAAGLRTHALVCVASAMVMIVSAHGFSDSLDLGSEHVTLDPSRVAAQVVTGVGFLGAGVIIYRRNSIQGLTTAASLWAIAGIGLACGGGLIWAAVLAAGIILAIQALIRPIERRYLNKRSTHHLILGVDDTAVGMAAIEKVLHDQNAIIRHITVERSADLEQSAYIDLVVSNIGNDSSSAVIAQMNNIPGTSLRFYEHGDQDSRQQTDDDADDGRRLMPGRRSGWWTKPVDGAEK
jgi:putative Mg2+ transporter-C (MgtC) family protein